MTAMLNSLTLPSDLFRSRERIRKIEPLVYAIEIRDAYTQGHSQRVANYAVFLSQWMGMEESFSEKIFTAGMLHDLGKIGIPDEILLKPGRLNQKEYDLIKLHSSLSEKIIGKLEQFGDLMPAVRHHHENYDGSGYPDALAGESIPLMARIISIVDVFDALTTRRIYRDSMTLDKALEIMHEEQQKGKFDPALFSLFVDHIPKIGVLDAAHLSAPSYPELEERRNSFHFKNPSSDLLNRDALLAFLRKGSSHGESAFLAEINIRHFSEYNRHYGLAKGDALLVRAASILRKHLDAHSELEEPLKRKTYLFHGYADRFYLLEFGFRSAFLVQRLEKTMTMTSAQLPVDLYWKPLLNAEKIPSNIEQKLGYLL
ncbi:MAG: HD domain-containing protein [Campylobacterales bacterium]|nr:HD domain-containing protein [Campylobacterales bacterium]